MLSQESGYIRFVDTGRLVALAKSHHVQDPRSPASRSIRSGGNAIAAGLQGGPADDDGEREILGA